MADRTVRAIFDAVVAKAKKNMQSFAGDVADTGKKVDGLTKDLKDLDKVKAKPDVDVEIDKAKKSLTELTGELAELKSQPTTIETEFKIEQTKAAIKDVRGLIKDLTATKAEVRIDASIKDAQKRIGEVTQELGLLRTMEVTPQVTADIKAAKKQLADAKSSLRELNGAKAEIKVTADTSSIKSDLKADVADAGADAGDEAGDNIARGILDAITTIPIAGAVVGIGAALAFGILDGLKDGLQVEAGRDLFSARTGLDEATSARFGRAAGEAYGNAWGESVEANLDTARLALQNGLIDSSATDAEIENVITKLSGLSDLFDFDIAESVRGVGNLIKTGLVKDADQAFDLITAASKKIPTEDLLDTVNEYSNQFVTLGLTAEESFGLIVQGAQAGARDTDIVADAIKELGLRVGEGLEPAADALTSLGLNAKDTIKAFQQGGPQATAAMDLIFDALQKLDAQGGNTQEVVAALFGGPGEDLGAALYALDLDTVAAALGGVNGAAGSADRALATMSDNAASKVESAKRQIAVAADGIKGALAAAFSDEIGGAADWVARNRAPLMQFFLDVINGTIQMASAFAGFSAEALDGLASLIDGFEALIDAADKVPFLGMFDADEAKAGLASTSASIREAADTIRTEVPSALDEVSAKANAWAAPELLKARIHDASMAMSADMDAFSAKVNASGGEVTINGNSVNAEQALEVLKANINAEDGTVTINGNKVPAERALDVLMGNVGSSKDSVTIGGDTSPARGDLSGLMSKVNASGGDIDVGANTASANRAINDAARDRFSTITVGYRFTGTRPSQGLGGAFHGGLLPGKQAGGLVPGPRAGYDNVLWPTMLPGRAGGGYLDQPLEGREFVVNSRDTANNLDVLKFINSGGRLSGSSAGDPALLDEIRSLRAAISSRPVNVTATVDGRVLFQTTVRQNEETKARGGRGL